MRMLALNVCLHNGMAERSGKFTCGLCMKSLPVGTLHMARNKQFSSFLSIQFAIGHDHRTQHDGAEKEKNACPLTTAWLKLQLLPNAHLFWDTHTYICAQE